MTLAIIADICVFYLQIYTNGYITFGLGFKNRNPKKLQMNIMSAAKLKKIEKRGMALMAPLWTDNDATKGDVYYHIYDLANAGSTATDLARVQVCTSYHVNHVIFTDLTDVFTLNTAHIWLQIISSICANCLKANASFLRNVIYRQFVYILQCPINEMTCCQC